jgi:hypothetical protein
MPQASASTVCVPFPRYTFNLLPYASLQRLIGALGGIQQMLLQRGTRWYLGRFAGDLGESCRAS